jgi:hypothetical protein
MKKRKESPYHPILDSPLPGQPSPAWAGRSFAIAKGWHQPVAPPAFPAICHRTRLPTAWGDRVHSRRAELLSLKPRRAICLSRLCWQTVDVALELLSRRHRLSKKGEIEKMFSHVRNHVYTRTRTRRYTGGR